MVKKRFIYVKDDPDVQIAKYFLPKLQKSTGKITSSLKTYRLYGIKLKI